MSQALVLRFGADTTALRSSLSQLANEAPLNRALLSRLSTDATSRLRYSPERSASAQLREDVRALLEGDRASSRLRALGRSVCEHPNNRDESIDSESGIWVGDIPAMGDLRLKVRGVGSLTFHLLLVRSLLEPGDSAIDGISDWEIAEALLLDWEGLTHNGEPLAFDPKLARQMLSDDANRLLVEAVIWAAEQAR